jgi:hypothetical protein
MQLFGVPELYGYGTDVQALELPLLEVMAMLGAVLK